MTRVTLNRGLLFWGLALITAGATALAVQQGYVDRQAIIGGWRLWPVILIGIGLSLILARTPFAVLGTVLAALILGVAGGALVTVGPGVACGGEIPAESEQSAGEFTGGDAATVELDFNCGELDVSMADGAGWAARTAVAGDRGVDLTAAADSLEIGSAEDGWSLEAGRQRWEVELGSAPTYALQLSVNGADSILDLRGGTFSELDADPNAGSLSIDLSGATIEDLSMSMNAGSASIQTDASTALQGTIDVNAGSLELCTAADAPLRIALGGNVPFSHNLDGSGLSRSGDTWTSDTFGAAERGVDLRVEGNAASLSLNPDGGCS
jgi:hypothetical protein